MVMGMATDPPLTQSRVERRKLQTRAALVRAAQTFLAD
jgi:hypothetical protein